MKQSILIIDNDYAMRRGIALTLKGHGFAVYEAQGRSDGLQIVDDRNIDLALIDLYLDHDDGMTIAETLRERHPRMKVVLLTAHVDRDRAKVAQQVYKDNFLEKAFLEERLLKKIEDVLGIASKD